MTGRPSGRSPQTLSVEDRRTLAGWAADCVEDVLSVFESAAPDDARAREAVERTREFATGDLDVREAIRARGGQAGVAAREAPTPAARAAAYAAEQAAAVAHMGAHALGAAGYAGKARVMVARGSGVGDDDVIAATVLRQLSLLDEATASALRLLPRLGENTAGPLGPGRLTHGAVGATIRAIQDRLHEGGGP